MSDTLTLTDSGAPLPEFLTRLREGRFVSPSGVESAFLFDILSRSGAKKTVAHEIADSDDSVLQDLGAGTRVYPMEVYFVGGNYDQAADAFFESLYERYTPDKPGILKHPRWGDIPVMPFDGKQEESFVNSGVGISRVTVEFRQTKSLSYPASSGLNKSVVEANVAALQAQVETVTTGIDISATKKSVGFLSRMLAGISDLADDVQTWANSVIQDIQTGLDNLFAEPSVVVSQIGTLISTVSKITTETPEKVNAFVVMATGTMDTYIAEFETLIGAQDKQDAADSLQGVGALTCAGAALVALNTDFTTRGGVGDVIDSLTALYAAYLAGINAAYSALDGTISKQFIPDHDVQSGLYGIFAATNQLLINRAFDLKAKRVMRLTAPSDALTLTWELYGDIERLAFFCSTNHIGDDEFNEIPAGREVVAYV